jgi:hypothetical protein
MEAPTGVNIDGSGGVSPNWGSSGDGAKRPLSPSTVAVVFVDAAGDALVDDVESFVGVDAS